MPNLIQTAAAWLGAQLKESAGIAVTIQRGERCISGITGWVGKHDYFITDAEGFTTSITAHDWQLVSADIPGDFLFRPGVVIRAVVNSVEQVYEAMPLGKTKPCVEDLDTSGVLLTVHTNQVQ